MKKTAIIATMIIILGCTNASAAIFTFDDLTPGDYGDSLNYGGMTINTYPGSHLQVTDQTADGFGNAHSLPNKLSVWGDHPWAPKEKTSFSIYFDSPVTDFSFWLTGTFHDTTVKAYDLNSIPLETYIQTYPITGPLAPDGTPWDYYYDRQLRFISLSASNIHNITIQPSAYDGFSIDDLSYEVVPEPTTMALMGIGLLSAGVIRRRKKS